jgi:hypothetical protein
MHAMKRISAPDERANFTYHTPIGLRWGFAVMFICLTGLTVILVVKFTLFSFAAMGPPGYVLLFVLFGVPCALGWFTVRLCIGAARGLPRVTISNTGVRLCTAFDEKWAEWTSLSVFVEKRVLAARGTQMGAVSKIIGPDVSPNLKGEPEFVISAGQLMRNSIADLVHELNARRPTP